MCKTSSCHRELSSHAKNVQKPSNADANTTQWNVMIGSRGKTLFIQLQERIKCRQTIFFEMRRIEYFFLHYLKRELFMHSKLLFVVRRHDRDCADISDEK